MDDDLIGWVCCLVAYVVMTTLCSLIAAGLIWIAEMTM